MEIIDIWKGWLLMKKKFLMVLGIVLCAALLVIGADHFADSLMSPELSAEEIAFLKGRMVTYECYDDDFVPEALYDRKGHATHMLGYSAQGYVIYERRTRKFYEGGSSNPYREHLSAKKYYGGLFYYYVEQDGQYYDVQRGSCFE